MGRLDPNASIQLEQDTNIHELGQDHLQYDPAGVAAPAAGHDHDYEKPHAFPPPEPVIEPHHHYNLQQQQPAEPHHHYNFQQQQPVEPHHYNFQQQQPVQPHHYNIGMQQFQQQPNIANNNIGMQQFQQFGQPAVGVAVGTSLSPLVNIPSQQNQPWKTGLFGCMDDPLNAIITLLFPCVTFGQVAEILDSGSSSCATSGMLYGVVAFCIAMPCIMSCSYRTKIRSRFGLVESPGPDWLVHCFCEHCALCQLYRELNERGLDPSIGWMGNVAKQQQRQQFGMTPPMQQRMN